MVPIYEQIVDQIKLLIRNGELKDTICSYFIKKLLDKPAAGLDIIVRDALLEMLREFMEKKRNALF